DRPDDLKQALEFVLRRAKLVVVTGGLGPTLNDITRETLSEFTGIPLVESPELVAEMERRFGTSAGKLRANLRRQCLVPRKGAWLANPFGTAAGLVFEHDDYVLIALPGPPRELQSMLRDRVIPYIERKYGVRSLRSSITLRFVGIGQSQIEQTLRDSALVPSDVWVSTQFEGGRVDYTFSLPEDNQTNRTRLRDLARRVREVLGDHIYAEGTTTLEERVVELLKARRIRLVIVEIGSAGRLTAALSNAAGATDVVTASYVALTERQMQMLLNVPEARWPAAGGLGDRLRCIAEIAKERTGADWVIAVGPINTDQGSSGEALVGAGDIVREWQTQRFPAQGKGELVQANLVTHILARVCRQLEQ
ncbi:MAG: molybdopterin-binding protein, partial [Verrucomicrobiia bacterium]